MYATTAEYFAASTRSLDCRERPSSLKLLDGLDGSGLVSDLSCSDGAGSDWSLPGALPPAGVCCRGHSTCADACRPVAFPELWGAVGLEPSSVGSSTRRGASVGVGPGSGSSASAGGSSSASKSSACTSTGRRSRRCAGPRPGSSERWCGGHSVRWCSSYRDLTMISPTTISEKPLIL